MARWNSKTAPRIPTVSRYLVPFLSVCLLSGCLQTGVSSLLGLDSKPAAERTAATVSETASATVDATATEPAEARQVARTEPTIDDNPDKLVGLSPSRIAEQLGSPAFVRRDGPAEVWQYAAEACILDVFLYRDGEAFTVSYVSLRGRGPAQRSRRECYAEMLRTQATRRQG